MKPARVAVLFVVLAFGIGLAAAYVAGRCGLAPPLRMP